MVKFVFYQDIQEIDQIPENYYDFIQAIGILFNVQEVDKLTLEYTNDNKNFHLLNEESYNNFFLSGKPETTVFIYSSFEESNTYKNKNKEDEKLEQQETIEEGKIEEKEDDEEEINTETKNNINTDNVEIKVPEITKDMVINSILKQVRENMQKSRILMQQKEKEEEEKRKKLEKEEKERKEKEEKEAKAISDQIGNLITNRLDNLKKELINESQIKFSEIMSESQLNLKNLYENNNGDNNNNNDENKENNENNENTQIIQSLEEHPGISCSKCGMNPIKGNRYCCVYCNNVNYCEKCEELDGLIHGHPLYKLKLRI